MGHTAHLVELLPLLPFFFFFFWNQVQLVATNHLNPTLWKQCVNTQLRGVGPLHPVASDEA